MTIDAINAQRRHEIDQCRPLLDWLDLEEATRLRGYLECTVAQRMAAAGAMGPEQLEPMLGALLDLDEEAFDELEAATTDAPPARDTLPNSAPRTT